MKKISILLTLIFISGNLIRLTAQPLPPYVPVNGLKAYYGFNGNANDESGNGNNGIVNGATLTTSRFGNANTAYLFDGVSNYIDLTNSFDYPQRTINIWINSNLVDFVERHIYISDNPNLSNGFTQIKTQLKSGANYLVSNACNGNFYGQHNFLANSWTMCTLVIAADSVRHYYNGVLFHTSPLGTITSAIGNPSALLATSRIFDRYFSGKLDDLGIWSRALSQAEINNLFIAGFVGIDESASNGNYQIYPNPATTSLTIEQAPNVVSQVYIRSSNGQLVYNELLKTENTQINTQEFKNGVYWVQRVTENEVLTQKLVICK